MKCVFKHQDLQIFGFKVSKYGYFFPLEVVGFGHSEIKLQVGEYLNQITLRFKG